MGGKAELHAAKLHSGRSQGRGGQRILILNGFSSNHLAASTITCAVRTTQLAIILSASVTGQLFKETGSADAVAFK